MLDQIGRDGQPYPALAAFHKAAEIAGKMAAGHREDPDSHHSPSSGLGCTALCPHPNPSSRCPMTQFAAPPTSPSRCAGPSLSPLKPLKGGEGLFVTSYN